MSGFLSLGPNNVQLMLFLSPSSFPPGLAHKLIQKLPNLSRLAGGQLVAQHWQERRFAEVGGEAKIRHLFTLQSRSCQGQQPGIFDTVVGFSVRGLCEQLCGGRIRDVCGENMTNMRYDLQQKQVSVDSI